MPDDASRQGTSGRPTLAVLAGLFLGTLALRPQLVGIGPLLPLIQADLGISYAVAGLLAAIPVLLMGLFAPLGPWVGSRIGPRDAVALCMVAIVGFGLLRPALPGVAGLLLTTVGIGIGLGTAGALLPIVVRLRAPGEPARATGFYAAGIVAGSLLAAGVAVPLADALGGWRATLVVFAIAGLGSLAAWLLFLRPDPPAHRATGRPSRLPWTSVTAWMLVAVFATQSLLYYSAISWLPAVYVERGWDEAAAGNLVAVLHAVGLAAGIAVPLIADRVGNRRSQLLTVASITLVGFLGIVVVPDTAFLWAAVIGLGMGAVFPLVLTLPVDVAEGPAAVGATAAFMLLFGYTISSLGPVGLGLLRDATGSYTTSLWLLVLLSVGLLLASLALSPARLHRGVRPVEREAMAAP
jgi:CP family cyanate transporter-like MFS transporter